MATIASRLTNTGALLVNGGIDEVSFNTTAGNSAIVNQAVYSQNPSGTGWTGYNRTVTTNYAVAPDGTFTAARIVESSDSVNTIHGFGQSQTGYIAGNRYTISFYMKSYSANRAFIFGVGAQVIGGVVGTNYVYAYCDPDLGTITNSLVYAPAAQTTAVVNAGNGWYRFSLSFLAANTATNGVDIQFQGGAGKNQQTYIGDGTSGVLFWGLQIQQNSSPTTYQGIAAANTLVTPTWATKTAPDTVYATGVFDEVTYNSATPTIKNLLSYSQDFTNSVWTNYQQYANSIVITGNITTAPDGTLTASKLASNNASATYYSFFRYGASGTTANTYHIYSTYFKAAEETHAYITFYSGYNNSWMWDLSTQTLSVNSAPDSNLTITSTPSLTSVGNGWYRAAIPFRYGNTIPASWAYKYGLDGGSRPVGNGFYLWGAQLETGNVATTYQGVTASNTLVAPNFARRETQSGDMYVANSYDEFTGAPVVDGNLKLWLDAGQVSSYSGSGATWTDLSGNNNTGTLTSSPGFNNPTGSITFNGSTLSGNTITFAGTVTGTSLGIYQGSFTVGAWVNNNITTTGSNTAPIGGGIFSIDGSAVAGGQYAIFNRWGNIWVDFYGGGQNGPAVTSNTWYYIAHTYNYATKQSILYQNGVAVNTSTRTQDLVASVGSTSPKIGMYGLGGSWWNGYISSVHVYNRALSADEVAQNFNALRRRYNI